MMVIQCLWLECISSPLSLQVALMSIGVANILQSPEGVWSKGKPRLSCFGGVGGVTTFISVGSILREWGPGELEFEALMRMLDNKVCMNTLAKPLRLFYIVLSAISCQVL